MEAVPGKHSIESLQKTATLGTSHIIWGYCSVKLEACEVGIAAGSREVPGRKARDKRHPYHIIITTTTTTTTTTIIIIIIIIVKEQFGFRSK